MYRKMELLYFTLLCFLISIKTTICNTIPSENRALEPPFSTQVTVMDEPTSFRINWTSVDSVDDSDPILGYKVKVVEVKSIKKIVYKRDPVTQKFNFTEVMEYPEVNSQKAAEGIQTILKSEAVENPEVTFSKVRLGVPYEISISAYTKNQEGPPSSTFRVTVDPDTKYMTNLN